MPIPPPELAPRLDLVLPPWVDDFLRPRPPSFRSPEDRMRLCVDLARANVAGGGGPFGAAVFERDSGRLVAPGMNLVLPARSSVLHAEMTALIMAEKTLGSHDLSSPGLPACELVTTVEPCAMCLGAIPWSGVGGLVCGAWGRDAEAIGFDEGAKPPRWAEALRRRGIQVRRGVLRGAARAVLEDYRDRGGIIY